MRWRNWMMAAALALPINALAQDATAPWTLDPSLLAASGNELLQRVPDPQVDALLLTVHDAMREDAQAQVLCGLFDPQADRSLEGMNAIAAQLPPASRDRFAAAIGDALVAALQSPPQPYDGARAMQSIKAAGVTAALLHDGFTAGFNAPADAPDSQWQRCRSVRWLLDAMQARPAAERAAMTRLLLQQGLSKLAPDA
ncbi:hypothetical protein [Cognatiluteimonas telluris]|uniref:hypothetical protein n=1 Tax=Cognatiluteimonas telluris TaxID=1104775 RepID=UPI001408EE75|nr:hypothetical protein [Lysobacter telluris]